MDSEFSHASAPIDNSSSYTALLQSKSYHGCIPGTNREEEERLTTVRVLDTRVTGKTSVPAACHLPDPISETGIESLWAIHSDGWRWVCTLTGHLKFHFKVALFIRRTKCRKGVWNSGES